MVLHTFVLMNLIAPTGLIRTNWATPHIPLTLALEDPSFYGINTHHYYAVGVVDAHPSKDTGKKREDIAPAPMYQAVVLTHLRFESVHVSTQLPWAVRGPLILMNIQGESDPLWEICLGSLNSLSASWQKYQAATTLGSSRKRYQVAVHEAINTADVFLANLLFYKADAEKLFDLMNCVEKKQDDEVEAQKRAAMAASATDYAQAVDTGAESQIPAAIAASANEYAQKAEDLKEITGDLFCRTTKFGHFDNIKQILDTRPKLYAGLKGFMGTLGQRFAD